MTLDPKWCRERLKDAKLYLVFTRSRCRLDPLRVLDEALNAGVDIVQIREPGAKDRELLEWVHDVRERTALHRVPLVINDRVDIAMLGGAEGVHLGQEDLPPRAVREMAGPGLLIGLSTHDVDQVKESSGEPVDYIGIGPIFDTDTKGLSGRGVRLLTETLQLATLPAFGIGGFDQVNVHQAVREGLTRLAVSLAICGAERPSQVAEALRGALDSKSA